MEKLMYPAPSLIAHPRLADDAQTAVETSLRTAERFLADTVESVSPATPAPELLGVTARYRAQLAALVAVCRSRTG
jgi:hypothetical protein